MTRENVKTKKQIKKNNTYEACCIKNITDATKLNSLESDHIHRLLYLNNLKNATRLASLESKNLFCNTAIIIL
jgi:hypothetical protein